MVDLLARGAENHRCTFLPPRPTRTHLRFSAGPERRPGLEVLELLPSIEEPLWLHFNVLDNRTRRYLEKLPDLDEEERAMLLGSETRIQARMLDDGFVVILGDLHHDFNLDPEAFGTIRVYCVATPDCDLPPPASA